MAVMHYDQPQYRCMAPCGRRGALRVTKDKAKVTCKVCLKSLGVEVEKKLERVTPKLVQAKLTAMFAEVEPAFRAETRGRYKRQAEAEHHTWIERLETSDDGKYKSPHGYMNTYHPGQYVRYERRDEFDGGPFTWNGQRIAKGRYFPDYKRAERDADAAVEGARQTFLHRQGQKIAAALEGREDLKEAVGQLRFDGVIVGGITVRMENGDKFTLYTQIITNYRFEPRYVAFYQFPSRFNAIVKDGTKYTTKSVAWMEESF